MPRASLARSSTSRRAPEVASPVITPDEIDGSFVPRARAEVARVEVGAEVVLGRLVPDSSYLQACALNESGAIVWQCFDGSGTVDEIAADIADVFGADPNAVVADVCALAREVGAAGLLEGVEPARLDDSLAMLHAVLAV